MELISLVLTPFFGTCQFVERAADRRWAGVGTSKRIGAYWAFGPERASQPMELRKRANEIMLASYVPGYIMVKSVKS